MIRYVLHVHSIERFLTAASAGSLPSVSIVDPDFRACSEENPQDIREGEAFAARIINAVMQGVGWPHTLLIWVYDEHGGYFDHVPPPAAVVPDDRQPEGNGPGSLTASAFGCPRSSCRPTPSPTTCHT